ncbi:MAG: hypothetical protein COC19_04100 [SAR86 cluster bacterium]|uniref:TonB C-terminal domain-containing protein n=1 Tax=SAR86 cluster bacterium TaxID=2030880 RepID=A0A2A4MPN2_9GAMM|nr:MAG: hypothetical protein COC19_04100 [SAR86 cluster bacterium]
MRSQFKVYSPGTYFWPLLLLLLYCNSSFSADSKLAASEQLLQQQQAYSSQLSDLESLHGQYHPSLLEPLSGLVEVAQAMQNHDRVSNVLRRQLLIVRAVQGLQHIDQIPLIEALIDSQIRLGNWQEVGDHFEHLRLLKAADADNDDQLQAIDDLLRWNLARVYLENSTNRERYIVKADDLSKQLVDLAEDKYGKHSPALIPWLYEQALQQYRLAELWVSENSLSAASLERLSQSNIRHRSNNSFYLNTNMVNRSLLSRDPVAVNILRRGLNTMKRIHNLLESTGDRQAQAMALIYQGDFQLLMGFGSAQRSYREAWQLLIEAGIDKQRISLFFSHPVKLPVESFFYNLEQASTFQRRHNAYSANTENIEYLGEFTAWHKSIGSVRQPLVPAQMTDLDLHYQSVDVSFAISRNGKTSSLKLIDAPEQNIAPAGLRRNARQAVRKMLFRPHLVDGRSTKVEDVRISYRELVND